MIDVTLEPGNATRYDLSIVHVDDDSIVVIVFKDRTRRAGWAMRFDRFETQEPYFVARQADCHVTEAAVVLVYLREAFDLPVALDHEYDQETGVWKGMERH
jgi:hypothetical protein